MIQKEMQLAQSQTKFYACVLFFLMSLYGGTGVLAQDVGNSEPHLTGKKWSDMDYTFGAGR
jgi:hypothetical protein